MREVSWRLRFRWRDLFTHWDEPNGGPWPGDLLQLAKQLQILITRDAGEAWRYMRASVTIKAISLWLAQHRFGESRHART